MELNTKLLKKLQKFDDPDGCMLYLLGISLNLNTSSIKLSIKDKANLVVQDFILLVSGDRKYKLSEDPIICPDLEVDASDIEAVVNSRFREYQAVFSVGENGTRGLKRGVMGSSSSIKKKLLRWLKEHPEYTIDDVINAARYYIKSIYQENGNYRYLRKAGYFIYKQEGLKDEEVSDLEAYILEAQDQTVEVDTDDLIAN